MKFEMVNGVPHIVLEKNERVVIKLSNRKEQINIKGDKDGLNIIGSSSIIKSICGNGMLEKVYIPPVLSAEEIIEKCDRWLEMFKQVHDVFKKLVLTDEYRDVGIKMYLSFQTFSLTADPNTRGKIISLDLTKNGAVIREGVSISLYDTNENIYSYLVASVLAYYVSQNLKNQKIDMSNFNGILCSTEKNENGNACPIMANVTILTDTPKYYNIVASILANNSVGYSSEQILANQKKRISAQQIDNRMDSEIEKSAKQCEYILK